jgi:hypothetical protein
MPVGEDFDLELRGPLAHALDHSESIGEQGAVLGIAATAGFGGEVTEEITELVQGLEDLPAQSVEAILATRLRGEEDDDPDPVLLDLHRRRQGDPARLLLANPETHGRLATAHLHDSAQHGLPSTALEEVREGIPDDHLAREMEGPLERRVHVHRTPVGIPYEDRRIDEVQE